MTFGFPAQSDEEEEARLAQRVLQASVGLAQRLTLAGEGRVTVVDGSAERERVLGAELHDASLEEEEADAQEVRRTWIYVRVAGGAVFFNPTKLIDRIERRGTKNR